MKSGSRYFRYFLGLLMVVFLCTACNSRIAATIALTKTEGEVEIVDRRGKEVPPKDNLHLFDGYMMGTYVLSYAWMDLDQERMVKLDQESQIEIQKERKKMEIVVQSGSLFFQIDKPLEEDESLDIRTSSMIVGIRGTCGWVEVFADGDGMRLYLLEGKAECSAGEMKKDVLAGEMAEMTKEGEITVSRFTAQDIPDFVIEELQEEDREKIEVLNENGDGSGEESAENLIINNGGSVVRFGGNDYYWKYTADSVENQGLFAHFYLLPEAENQMICRHPDGTEKVLFTMTGNGDIYLTEDRMYLSADNSSYSVKMDGSDRIDYGYTRWLGTDVQGKTVFGYDGQKLISVYAQTGERTELADSSAGTYGYEFAGVVDDYLYFSSCDTDNRELVLYQVKTDGSAGVQEADRFSLSRYGTDLPGNVFVTQLSRLGSTLYYSYGYYAGTGGFFQEGGINYVLQDENRITVESGVLVDKITAEEFLVEENQGAVNVYYIDGEYGTYIGYWQDTPYDNCMVMDSRTKTVQPSSFRLSRPGAAVYMDGAVYREDEHQASYMRLIPEALAAAYGCSDENPETVQSLTLINDVEVVGNDVYYTVEKSSPDPQGDVGWRAGFIRNSSERYKMTVGGTDAELLFSY